jgi:hypothetical protein
MSHRFRGVLNIINAVFDASSPVTSTLELRVKSLLLVLAGVGQCIYAHSTGKAEAITVVKKYKMNRIGYTDFMIIDEKGRHFNVNNSLWYWKWDAIEDWHKIEENSKEKLLIGYYGWRIPVLGVFPNIVISADGANFLSGMTGSEFRKFKYDNLR